MLSPENFHTKVPRDIKGNLAWRLHVLEALPKDPALAKALVLACSQDVLFYINTFVWQYNPRKRGASRVAPFITWPFQDEAVRQILSSVECHCAADPLPHQHDLLIEKSREMGASWLCLIVMEWLWHFTPWCKFLCISRNEKSVEDDDPDSLFWKIDFIHRHLPSWLKPKIKRRKLYFGNEDNGSTITGEASTGRAGVGGRATAMFIDEFSQIKEDYDVLHRTSDTTGCRIFNGTHCGTGTAFAELANRVDMRKLVMHWTQHPDKRPGLYKYHPKNNNVEVIDKSFEFPQDFEFVLSEAPAGGPFPGLRSPWYDRECGRKGSPRAVAMDLDIDAGGSVSQVFNPISIRTLISAYCTPPLWQGDISYDPDTGKPLGLSARQDGPLLLWLHPKPNMAMPLARYVIGCDLSTGMGATNSVLSIGNADSGEKAGEFASPIIRPETMALIAIALCWTFKDEEGQPALLVWEHRGPGLQFAKAVLDAGYRRIYWREGNSTDRGRKLGTIPGWSPAPEQKRLLIDEYRAALDGRHFINRSELALRECLYFRYMPDGNVEHMSEARGGDPILGTQGDPTGARVNHGDRVIADALVWKMIKGRHTKISKMKETGIEVGSLGWRRQLATAASEDDWS